MYKVWILLLLATGCVSKGRLELAEVQLDATRTALSTRQAACVDQTQSLTQQVFALEEEIEARALQLTVLTDSLDAQQEELSMLRAEKAAWAIEEAPDSEPSPPSEDDEHAVVRQAALVDLEAGLELIGTRRTEDRQRARRHAEVEDAFSEVLREGWGTLEQTTHGSQVTLPVHILFQENRVALSPRGEMVLQRVAIALQGMQGRRLQIDGHTDNVPRNSIRFSSNWELGFGYAALVLRTLAAEGVRLPTVAASFAGTAPRIDEDTEEARRHNRRIVLVLVEDLSISAQTFEEQAPPDADGHGDG